MLPADWSDAGRDCVDTGNKNIRELSISTGWQNRLPYRLEIKPVAANNTTFTHEDNICLVLCPTQS